LDARGPPRKATAPKSALSLQPRLRLSGRAGRYRSTARPRAAGNSIEGWVFALNGDHDPGDPAYRAQIRAALGGRFVDISRISGVQVARQNGFSC